MKEKTRILLRHPFLPLALAFLALNLIVTQDGGQNAKSRLLSMRSFSEYGHFRLDDYLKVTDDWAIAPSGHYYSNKAPGPTLLGIPVFFVADKLHLLVEDGFRDERGLRPDPGYMQSTVTSFLMQALPFALLVLCGVSWLGSMGVGFQGQLFFALAALFGNTAALFMNSYFGHGFEALLQLGGILFLLQRRFAWSGMMFSFAMLSGYGFSVQIPALLLALVLAAPGLRGFLQFSAAAIPGALLWVLYHGLIFGSPLAVASRFQNEVFLEEEGRRILLWGILHLPDHRVLWELLFGKARGLIVGQPWVYAVAAMALGKVKAFRASREFWVLFAFCFLSLPALVLMNASFNGWHGGATAGPRYLSAIFPAFALLGGLVLGHCPKLLRWVAWILLGIAVIFRGVVYGGTILGPVYSLWAYYTEQLLSRGTHMLRSAIFLILLALALELTRRRVKKA